MVPAFLVMLVLLVLAFSTVLRQRRELKVHERRLQRAQEARKRGSYWAVLRNG